MDEIYDATILRFVRFLGQSTAIAERTFFSSIGKVTALFALGFGWLSRLVDNLFIDPVFDRGCQTLRDSSRTGVRLQNGQVQNYLRSIALALAVLVLLLAWGCKGG